MDFSSFILSFFLPSFFPLFLPSFLSFCFGWGEQRRNKINRNVLLHFCCYDQVPVRNNSKTGKLLFALLIKYVDAWPPLLRLPIKQTLRILTYIRSELPILCVQGSIGQQREREKRGYERRSIEKEGPETNIPTKNSH